jgi:hypothetical protein
MRLLCAAVTASPGQAPDRVAQDTGEGWADFVFAFHDGEELGPRMLARIAKHAGLTPEDL